jgi:asparagine synthase (glutamine-hydrolysing)
MCGIAGIIDLNGDRIDPFTLVKMNTAIRHRGIDDEGYLLIDQKTEQYVSFCGVDSPPEIKRTFAKPHEIGTGMTPNIGLAQRRFSIIDLTSRGHQPFFTNDHSCCIVFNGEIYNYIELRKTLMDTGCIFHTSSDTEVLAEAYRVWGTGCFDKLNGFWAVAIYDFSRRQLILSRDRIGKKPLYWTKQGTRIYFASEIKALLQVQEIARCKHVNETAAYRWLAYGLRDIEESTLFEDIYSLPAASWSMIDSAFPNNTKRFWQVPCERMTEQDVSVSEASRTIRDILRDAVRIRLRSDVSWAVELSGGLDSSTLVAMASELHAEPFRTYTVRFPDKEWNEEPFARSVANKFNVDYQVLESPLDNFWSQILPFTFLQEEPYHAPNLQTNQVMWTLMRAVDTKVSLNGAAGDELFAGYGSYFQSAQRENWKKKRLKNFVNNALYWSEERRIGGGIFESLKSLASASPMIRRIYRMIQNSPLQDFIKLHAVNQPMVEKQLAQVLWSDMTNTKMPYWMRSGDKTYMGVPFEVRAPFLDYRLIEYVFQLPTTYLIRDGWHKWILRESMKGLLPEDVLWRKRKMGFPFPFPRFYKDNERILELIFNEAQNPHMDCRKMGRFKHNWKLVSFILWYELFFNENYSLFRAIADLVKQKNAVVSYGYVPEFLHYEQELI